MYAELHIRTITEIYGFIGVMVTCKAEKEKGVLQSDLHTVSSSAEATPESSFVFHPPQGPFSAQRSPIYMSPVA